MKILMIGGTHFIGRAIAGELISHYHDVHLFHRGRTKNDFPPARELIGDRMAPGEIERVIDRVAPDVIVDMIAMNDAAADLSLRAVQRSKFNGPYLLISSCDVYARFGEILGTERPGAGGDEGYVFEESPLRKNMYPYRGKGVGAWAEDYDKILVEQVLLRYRGTRVLRLPMIFGPRDHQRRIPTLLKALRSGEEQVPQVGWDWRSPWSFVENAARAAAGLLMPRVSGGAVYHLQDHAPTERELRLLVARCAGLPVPEIPTAEPAPDGPPDLMLDNSAIDQAVPLWREVSLESAVERTIGFPG